jgi:hypothetical protein
MIVIAGSKWHSLQACVLPCKVAVASGRDSKEMNYFTLTDLSIMEMDPRKDQKRIQP